MTQIFFPPNLSSDSEELYCYTNSSGKVVIVKLKGLVSRHCERVVFPGEKFLFKANDDCELEISQQTNTGLINDIIPCLKLKVRDDYAQACA